jgi:glycosyltransferase involved in cell wall biosynthesis
VEEKDKKVHLKDLAFISTVFNESGALIPFLASLVKQNVMPSEIILVDGGSTDDTLAIITDFFKGLKNTPGFEAITVFEVTSNNTLKPGLVFESILNVATRVKIYDAPGANISSGRNIAIKNAKSRFICVSDAGCRLSPDWIKEISKYFIHDPANIAAGIVAGGYNFPYIENFLQACLAVCILPIKSEIRQSKYMPSSRNISFAKAAWEKAGGYPQNMDFGEDMRFNFNLKALGYSIKFNPDALVYWNLRNSPKAIFRQFFRYAKGDAIGRMYSHRHLIRLASVFLFAALVLAGALISPWFLLAILLLFAAFIYRPYVRIRYFLNDKNCCVFTENKKTLSFTKLKTIFCIPLMLICIETAKLAGYIYGLFIRKNY